LCGEQSARVGTAAGVVMVAVSVAVLQTEHMRVGAPKTKNHAYLLLGHHFRLLCGQASSLDGSNGFTIYGPDEGDMAGYRLSSGDVNGDGYADVIVGAYRGDGSSNSVDDVDTGEAYVVFGKASGFAASIEVSRGGGAGAWGSAGDRA